MELKTINGKNLIPSEWNPRSTFDEDKLELLKKSMDGIGLLEPLVVRPSDNGKFFITAGERRWKSNPKSDFVCIVREENDLKAKVSCLVENFVRENIPDADHEKFISDIYNEGNPKEWKSYSAMELKTGIPNELISLNVMAHKDREELNLGNSRNVSTYDIKDTRGIADKPKARKKLLEKRNDKKITGAGRVLQNWTRELAKIPEEIGLEAMKYSDDIERVEDAVRIYEGALPQVHESNHDLSKYSEIDRACFGILKITPAHIEAIETKRFQDKSLKILESAYIHLFKLLKEYGVIGEVEVDGESEKQSN